MQTSEGFLLDVLLLIPMLTYVAKVLFGNYKNNILRFVTNVNFYENLSCNSCTRAKKKETEMVRVLNVAEKNDAARSITELMSDGKYRRREGRSVYNKIYEFEHNVFNQRCTMVMTSVSGHLLNLEFSGSYRKWQGCNPVALFDAPVTLFCPEDYKNIKETLEREVRTCTYLIIWTDCDREGENIGFEIIDVCKKVKPGIQIYRAKFSEITRQAIARAIRNLAPPDDRMNDAVNVRRELDLRIGAAFTRFQTLRLQKVFPDVLNNQLISYGSCQFPTLGFVVDRYKQVQAFIPEQFWKIKVLHKKEERTTEFTWKRGRLFDHTACLVLYQICLENPLAKVVDVKSRPKSKWRPQPLDTVELEKMASRKLRINAKEALNIAEKLYTKGFISYPRTETTIFPKELDLASLVQMQTGDPNWGAFAGRVLENGPNPRQGSKTDNAHPPIHPIKYVNSLQGKDKTIYDFVVRRFLACLSKDAEGRETVVEIDVNAERFAVNGLMIIARNYLEVYPYENWNAKEIAEYNLGETFQPTAIEMTESETKAPDLLSEADLIALMEKHGIGTDATHSEHIETIKSRLYVGVNESGRFVPGELGMGLVEGYDLMGFHMSKPHLRAELEADLKRICEGTKNPEIVLREQVAKYKEVFIEAVRQAVKIDVALSNYFQTTPGEVQEETYDSPTVPVMKCPRCNMGDIVIRAKRDNRGFFLSCMAFPQCNAAIWLPDCVEQVSVTDETCEQCQPGPVKKLKFKVKPRSLMPFFEDEFVTCIGGCDREFMEVANIRPLTVTNAASQSSYSITASSFQSTSSNNNERRPPSSDSGYSSGPSCKFQKNSSSTSRNMTTASSVAVNNESSNFRNPFHQSSFSSCPSFTRKPMNSISSNTNTVNRPSSNNTEIVCHCGKTAILLTVRKDGPNKGRQFYKCPENSCDFFLWDDKENTAAPSFNSSSFSPVNNFNPTNGFPSDTGEVLCQCGKPAVLLTVRKEGPNTGKQFYKCGEMTDKQCSFFQWEENSNNTVPSVSPFSSSNNFGTSRSQSAGDGSEPYCNCSSRAKLLTVHKEGPTKGRKFYVCPKSREDACKFFQWADDSQSTENSSSTSFRQGSTSAPFQSRRRHNSSSDNEPPSKRKCGLCSEAGHDRRSCPMR